MSSYLLAAGEPGRVLAFIDPDSDLFGSLTETRVAVMQLLEWRHRDLADAFAGMAPAPGGAFRMAAWEDTEWGPLLADASAWAGVRLSDVPPREIGWSMLVETVIERIEIGTESEPLVHRRGRYQRPPET